MITYHLRTPFTLVRRAKRLSSHATPHHTAPRRAAPRRAAPCHSIPRRAPRHLAIRRHTTLPPPRIIPRHAIALTVLCHYHRVGSSGCYAIDPTLRPTNSSLSPSFFASFASCSSQPSPWCTDRRPRVPVSYVLIATAACSCRGKLD